MVGAKIVLSLSLSPPPLCVWCSNVEMFDATFIPYLSPPWCHVCTYVGIYIQPLPVAAPAPWRAWCMHKEGVINNVTCMCASVCVCVAQQWDL